MPKRNNLALAAITAAVTMLSLPASAYTLTNADPGRWGGDKPAGTAAAVTYSFMGSGLDVSGTNPSIALSEFMPAGYKSEIVAAFDAWSSVAGLTFSEVDDPGVGWLTPDAYQSDIRISGAAFGTRALARAYGPPNSGGPAAGDLQFNSTSRWKIGFDGRGYDIFQVAAHEIGHAIGLKHVKSRDALMRARYTQSFRGPQADDIAGARAIYGEPITTQVSQVTETTQVARISPVPLPAALPLLGGVLAFMGGLGWCRTRRVAKACAA